MKFNSQHQEAGFYARLFSLALPLVIQNLITTSLGFVDTFMVGMLGQLELSAVTAANSPIFFMQMIVFGFISGLAVLTSQYWGKRDIAAINRCMGIALYIAVTVSTIAAAILFLAPHFIMGLVTNHAVLIELGAPYLQIVGLGYIFNTASSVYIGMQRSAENPAMGMIVFGFSMLLNTALNYVLIFGKLGAPAMGITGAALATSISRIVEFIITWSYAAKNQRIPLNIQLLLRPGRKNVKDFFRYAVPVLVNEGMWGLGISIMTVIMGHMDDSSHMLAAHAVMGNIDKFSTVACFGVAGASSILVGTYIGEGRSREEIYRLGWRLLIVSLTLGFGVSVILTILLPTVFIPFLYPMFHLQDQASHIAVVMCVVYIFMVPAKAFNTTNIVVNFRGGGDAKIASVIDLSPLWLVAIPLTALTGLVIGAPVEIVCVCIQAENIIKTPLSILRLRSRKWINDITK